MMRTPVRRGRWPAVAAALIAVLVLAAPAGASFPNQGSRVLYARLKNAPARTDAPERGGGAIDLFTMKPNGDDQTRVIKTDVIGEYGGHWSPNGSRIVFAGVKGKGHVDIYTADADGTHRDALTSGAANYSPNWSKSGNQIVWTRFSNAARPDATERTAPRGTGANLMVMNADGSDKHSIYPGYACSPGWDPTSQRIAFSTFVDDSTEIWTIKPSGLGLQQFTDYGSGSTTIFGDWAPDGDSFAFSWSPGIARGVTGGYSLWVGSSANTADTLLLASDVQPEFAPVFTTDGSRVIFVRYDGADYELFSVKTDGTGEKQLTTNAAAELLTLIPLF
jgi:Tol biopolymer transport system component